MGNAGRAVVLLAIAVAIVACQNTRVVIDTASPPNGTPGPCMAALTDGKLVVTPENTVGLLEPNGDGRALIWPAGYSSRQNGGVSSLDETGAVVAHVGDTVEIGGGEATPSGAWLVCPGQVVVREAAQPSS